MKKGHDSTSISRRTLLFKIKESLKWISQSRTFLTHMSVGVGSISTTQTHTCTDVLTFYIKWHGIYLEYVEYSCLSSSHYLIIYHILDRLQSILPFDLDDIDNLKIAHAWYNWYYFKNFLSIMVWVCGWKTYRDKRHTVL